MSTQPIQTAIDEAIAANNAAFVDWTTRYALDGLSDRLRRYRCNLSKLNPDEQALYAGPNMHGPAIADLIRDSKWHREHGAIQVERECAPVQRSAA